MTRCRRGDGTVEPVDQAALLPLDLDRALLPEPPCARVLDAAERAQVRATVVAFNAEIGAAIAELEGAGAEIALVDMFARFDGLAREGFDVHGDGTLVLTTGYLGGFFGLDGIHPTRTGHALVANAFIEAIDARFGETLPPVDVRHVAMHDPLVASRFQPVEDPPFGLIQEPADVLDASLDRVEDRVDEIADVYKTSSMMSSEEEKRICSTGP